MWHHLARCNPGVLRNTLASPRALNTFPIATGPVFSRMPFESHLKKLIAKTAIENFEVDGRKMYKHACRMASKALSPSPGTADTSPDGVLANDKCTSPTRGSASEQRRDLRCQDSRQGLSLLMRISAIRERPSVHPPMR